MENPFVVVVAIIPFLISVVTEIMKRIPQVPVKNKNAKLCVLIIAVIVVLGTAVNWQSLSQTILNIKDSAVPLATEIVIFYTSAVGFYETVKKLVAKI